MTEVWKSLGRNFVHWVVTLERSMVLLVETSVVTRLWKSSVKKCLNIRLVV